jgi:hypothetical protein
MLMYVGTKLTVNVSYLVSRYKVNSECFTSWYLRHRDWPTPEVEQLILRGPIISHAIYLPPQCVSRCANLHLPGCQPRGGESLRKIFQVGPQGHSCSARYFLVYMRNELERILTSENCYHSI